MTMKIALGCTMALMTAVLPAVAFAEGSVKVECWGRCDNVTIGQICDTYSTGTLPIAVACDDTAVGRGFDRGCGTGPTCRPWGTLVRSDRLSDYCDDGPGFDAVVTCRFPSASLQGEPSVPKTDDGEGALEPE